MRSSTSSFSLRVAAFVAVLLVTAGLLEVYCRTSKRFSDYSYHYIKLLTEIDPRDAILGDSHVGVSQLMPGYAFLGQPGQQPAELLRLVHHLYDRRPPRRVIVQAAPQWFGDYHRGRKLMLTDGAFAPVFFGLQPLILSRTYRTVLFDNLAADGKAILNIALPVAAKAAVPRPTPEETLAWVQDWLRLESERGPKFTWAELPADKRRLLTISRVYDQNPVPGFATSPAATDYEKAIAYLQSRGAKVCLFRTPVTTLYLETEKLIADSRYSQFNDYIARVAQKHSVPFINFASLPYTFDDDQFSNQDHMLGTTAAKVWPLVAERCFKDG